MVVEDDPAILDMTTDVLRAAGFEVIPAHGPGEALSLADDLEAPDLLLTDVVIPDMSGPALAATLSAKFPSLRVVYMAGYADDTHGIDAIDPAHLIHKPFTHSELLARIESTLGTDGGASA